MVAAVVQGLRGIDQSLARADDDRPRKIREVFDEITENVPDEGARLGDVVSSVGKRSTDIFILLSTVTAGIILQVPILPSLFAIPIMYLAATQILGIKNPFLFGAKKIEIDGKAVKEGLDYARWEMENAEKAVEKITSKFGDKAKKPPRLPNIPGSRDLHDRLQGGLALILGAMIMSPIPGTHTLPAIGLMMLSMGRLTNNRSLVAGSVGYSALIGIPVPAYFTYQSLGTVKNMFNDPASIFQGFGVTELGVAALGLAAAYGGYRLLRHRWNKYKEYKASEAPMPKPL